jgi:hypothetical protein
VNEPQDLSDAKKDSERKYARSAGIVDFSVRSLTPNIRLKVTNRTEVMAPLCLEFVGLGIKVSTQMRCTRKLVINFLSQLYRPCIGARR